MFEFLKTLFAAPVSTKMLSNPEFDSFTSLHRSHQTNAISAIGSNTIGQIVLPTGTGKTRIQEHIHINDMINNPETGVYVIAAHRLTLCSQLLNNIFDQAAKCNLNFNVLFIGSHYYNGDEILIENNLSKRDVNISSTTTSGDVLAQLALAEKQGKHLIIATTYHSCDKLNLLDKINVFTLFCVRYE